MLKNFFKVKKCQKSFENCRKSHKCVFFCIFSNFSVFNVANGKWLPLSRCFFLLFWNSFLDRFLRHFSSALRQLLLVKRLVHNSNLTYMFTYIYNYLFCSTLIINLSIYFINDWLREPQCAWCSYKLIMVFLRKTKLRKNPLFLHETIASRFFRFLQLYLELRRLSPMIASDVIFSHHETPQINRRRLRQTRWK